jgi:dihydropteroate synthase
LNDIWGLKKDSTLAGLAARYGATIILMSNQRDNPPADIFPAVVRDLSAGIERATRAGIEPGKIIIDPGIGFGKTLDQNLELIGSLDRFKSLGKPILLGTSRKSVIGLTLGLPEYDRLEGTAATVAIGIAAGADIIRVHDVKAMARVARMSDAITRRKT